MDDHQLCLRIRHSDFKDHEFRIRFKAKATIAQVKEKVHVSIGSEVQDMTLRLLNTRHNTLVGDSMNDRQTLADFGAEDGWELLVDDTNPLSVTKAIQEDSPKYEISNEAYRERATSKAFAKWRAGQKGQAEERIATHTASIAVNDAVTVKGRSAVVRFKGEVPQLGRGVWVGVEYEDPVGRHDGEVTVKGEAVRLFTCTAGHGAVVRPTMCIPAPKEDDDSDMGEL